MTYRNSTLVCAALFSAAIISSSAYAGVETLGSNVSVANYSFSVSNAKGFPDSQVGTLRIEQVGANTKWTLSANWNDQYNSGSPFVKGIDFEVMKANKTNQSSLPLFDVVGQIGLKDFSNKGVFFNTSNTTNRFTDGESASWIFNNTTVDGFVIKDLHVNSINNGKSVKFGPSTTPVPEPETYGMLLAGIGVVAWLRRRKAA